MHELIYMHVILHTHTLMSYFTSVLLSCCDCNLIKYFILKGQLFSFSIAPGIIISIAYNWNGRFSPRNILMHPMVIGMHNLILTDCILKHLYA